MACHQFERLERSDVLGCRRARRHVPAEQPVRRPMRSGTGSRRRCRQQIVEKGLRFYVVDGYADREGGRARDADQHRAADVLLRARRRSCPRRRRSPRSRTAIVKSYGKRGETILSRNFAAVDGALAALHEVAVPDRRSERAPRSARRSRPRRRTSSSDVTAAMIAGEGDLSARLARCPSTGRSRPTPPAGRSGASRGRSRSGIPRSASTARNARWSARTPRSG